VSNPRSGERLVEFTVAACGVSSIVLVAAIFAFIGRDPNWTP